MAQEVQLPIMETQAEKEKEKEKRRGRKKMRNQVFSINQGRQTKAQLVSTHKAHETRKHAGNCASSFPLHGLLPLRITLPLSLETFVRNLGELSDSAASLYGVDFLSLVVYPERGLQGSDTFYF